MKNKNKILNEMQIISNNFKSGNFLGTISKSKNYYTYYLTMSF